MPIGMIANQIAGGALGLMLGQYNDDRQYDQQRRLQELQIAGNKEMGLFNYDQQMKMWRDTNYSAQKEQMKLAGINPGLLYGMSGGGGTTTGSPGGGIQGADAPKGGGEVQGAMGMALQIEMLKAQKENIEADTAKKNVEATKLSGVDTQEGQTRILNLTQGIENAKAQEALTKIETRLKGLDEKVMSGTINERIDQIVWTALRANEELDQAARETFIKKATQNGKIEIIRQEAIGAMLRNALTVAQTDKTGSDIKVNEAQIQKMAADISQGWTGLDRQQKELRIRAFEAELKLNYPGLWNVVGAGINGALRKLDNMTGDKHMEVPNIEPETKR